MVDEISTLMTEYQGRMILLRLRTNKTIRGILLDFDVHMNMTLEDTEDISEKEPTKLGKILLRSDNILIISLPDSD